MKVHHIIFNIITLLIAAFFLLGLLSAVFIIMPQTPPDRQNFWYFIISLEAILIAMLGGGGIANFAKGRLAPWPTGIIIAGYCISVWLVPFAVWGAIALIYERKRQRNEAGSTEPDAASKEGPTASKDQSVFPY